MYEAGFTLFERLLAISTILILADSGIDYKPKPCVFPVFLHVILIAAVLLY